MLNLGQKIENISLRVGLMITLSLIFFFFLVKLIGLVHILELRVFNLLFIVSGIAVAINHYKKANSGNMTYLKGLGVGILTSTVAVGAFALFVLAYTLWLNPEFMGIIRENDVFGIYLNPFIISFVIFLEGTASGFLSSYVIMQYMKSSRLSSQYDQAM